MAREHMCEYGNCQETETPIVVSVKEEGGERKRFCSFTHLGQWAMRQAASGRVLARQGKPTLHELRFNTCTCGKWKAAGTTEQIEHLFALHVQAVLNS